MTKVGEDQIIITGNDIQLETKFGKTFHIRRKAYDKVRKAMDKSDKLNKECSHKVCVLKIDTGYEIV